MVNVWAWLRLIPCIFLNTSPSLPLGLYRAVPGPPRRGAIVVVCLPAPLGTFARTRGYLGRGPCPGDVERFGKIVAGVAGDHVYVDSNGVTINGALVPHSRALGRDTHGRLLPHAWGSKTIQPGELFLLATRHPRSFDSRYFGPVIVTGVVVIVPVATLSR
jgi:conjugative transfer signal peptidase TraF